ncbi:hypothetical protein, partial [Acetobacter fabarum]
TVWPVAACASLSSISGFLSLSSAFLSRLSGFFGDKNGSQRRIIIIFWFSTIDWFFARFGYVRQGNLSDIKTGEGAKNGKRRVFKLPAI